MADPVPADPDFADRVRASFARQRFRVLGRVRRAGRTVTFVEGEASAVDGASQTTVATTQATMICLRGRDGIRH